MQYMTPGLTPEARTGVALADARALIGFRLIGDSQLRHVQVAREETVAFEDGGRGVGPPSLGGAAANPTENVVCYLKGISRGDQAMARFPRRPHGPPRSASLRTNRLTRSRIVQREFGWFEGMVTEGVTP